MAFLVADRIEDVLEPDHGSPGRVKGFFLPRDRTVVLIRTHLRSVRDATETLRHEVLAHYEA